MIDRELIDLTANFHGKRHRRRKRSMKIAKFVVGTCIVLIALCSLAVYGWMTGWGAPWSPDQTAVAVPHTGCPACAEIKASAKTAANAKDKAGHSCACCPNCRCDASACQCGCSCDCGCEACKCGSCPCPGVKETAARSLPCGCSALCPCGCNNGKPCSCKSGAPKFRPLIEADLPKPRTDSNGYPIRRKSCN